MKYTLTIEAENPEELSGVVAAFSGLGVATKVGAKTPKKIAPVENVDDDDSEEGDADSQMTVEELRKKLKAWYGDDAARKEQVKKLNKEYSVTGIADLPKDKYAEFLKKLGIQ